MLYKFKSKAAGDVIMLAATGQRVLGILGKDAGAQGIVTPEQMQGAMAALQAAIADEEAQQQAAIAEAKSKGETPPTFESINLRKRAWPLVEMMQRSAKEAVPITWGV
jgi:Domain of unknown function (DUF1840)